MRSCKSFSPLLSALFVPPAVVTTEISNFSGPAALEPSGIPGYSRDIGALRNRLVRNGVDYLAGKRNGGRERRGKNGGWLPLLTTECLARQRSIGGFHVADFFARLLARLCCNGTAAQRRGELALARARAEKKQRENNDDERAGY